MVSEHRAAQALRSALASSDVNGFLEVPPPSGHDPDTIYVVAAQNCPHEAAQQADSWARQLAAKGIPVQRTSSISFNPAQVDRKARDRLSVASNPELGQVVEEFRGPAPMRGSAGS